MKTFFGTFAALFVISSTAYAGCGTEAWDLGAKDVKAKVHPELLADVVELARAISDLKPVEESVLSEVAGKGQVSEPRAHWLKNFRERVQTDKENIRKKIDELNGSSSVKAELRSTSFQQAKTLSTMIHFYPTGC